MYEIFAFNYTRLSNFLSLGFKYFLMFCCLEILELKCIYALKL